MLHWFLQEEELEKLHTRIKNTIVKKDESLNLLKSELQMAQLKIEQQTKLLEKQRQQMFWLYQVFIQQQIPIKKM